MVAVVEKFGIAYFGIPKSASTSIKLGLYQAIHGHPWPGDMMKVHPEFPIVPVSDDEFARYKDYWRFTIVRDPVNRFLSACANRVFDHNDLAFLDKPWYRKARRRQLGLSPYPDANAILEQYDRYCQHSRQILHHTRSVKAFIGSDLSYFDAVYTTSDLDRLKADLSERTGTDFELPRENKSAHAMPFESLTTKARQALLRHTSEDYELLKEYFSPPQA